MAASSLPVRRPLAERDDVLIDLTAVRPGPGVAPVELALVQEWLLQQD